MILKDLLRQISTVKLPEMTIRTYLVLKVILRTMYRMGYYHPCLTDLRKVMAPRGYISKGQLFLLSLNVLHKHIIHPVLY
uniref:Uncharacterized protein n=1 Tax=Octopus bimaculoides TaxID=37653 RepID=A0A0L8HYY4_OCTBM